MDYVLLVALAIAVIGLGFLTVALAGRDRRDHRTTRQLDAVERKLDLIIDHLGVDVPEPAYPEVVALLGRKKKVAAIKAYRKETGAGLAEAKTEVERIERARTTPTPPATETPAAAGPGTIPAPADGREVQPSGAAVQQSGTAGQPGGVDIQPRPGE